MEKIINMRDLGGMVTQQGLQIKSNKLFRAGNPSVANDADKKYLQQLGLNEIIDFRSEYEKRSAEQVFAEAFNWVAQPIFVGNLGGLLNKDFSKHQALETMHDIYRRFPIEFQSQFRYLLAQAEQGKTMLYHCTAGKDRTGFASLLLLSALGVNFDTIMEDYLVSNRVVEGLRDQLADLMEEGVEEDVLTAILGVSHEYLDNSIHVINKEFGGVEKYLTNTLSIDIQAIRDHYLQS